ncbi:nitrate- and nitrite sensing domain-containing protein [Streptomyces sp. LX-29]|uniref:sensor histidine kinase n=1 Tax=Streptomyces sp. LX-29 TaxID=2900152 RepID=UPI00240D7B8D|nr:nitrate- and nitrite sensing domain-containing protein [Streptomyces sp. LX-29]WFB07222.1 nitrate- and nitrite sensing domain-containing protein [Streptomyces sp. LX-29]
MQGRFKREGSASADPEPRGGSDRGSSPQRAQSTGLTPGDHGSDAGSGSGALPGAPAGGGGGGGGEAADKAQPKAKGPTGPGARIALRNWRISTRLVSLLALPVVAATTLGALRIETSLENIQQLDHMKLLTEMTQQATQLADALQEERDKSAGPLAGEGSQKDDRVVATREKTSRAITAFQEATADVDPNDPTMIGVQSTLVDISKQLGKIRSIRDTAYDDKTYIAQTVESYNELITSLLSLSQDMAQATSNSEMINSTRALATFSAAKEYASIQRAVISAALANPKGAALSANDRRYGKSALDKETEALRRFVQIRRDSSEDLLEPLNGGRPDITAADKYAQRVLRDANGLSSEKRTYPDWYDQDTIKLDEMSKIEQTLLSEMEAKARELRSDAERDAYLNGVLILLVLGISLVGAFVVARSMVRSLRRLQETAQEVAQKRLPELVKQLSEADPQDVDTSVESVGVHSRDEIGKVAAAFDDVHREAVRLAAEQALLRGNVNAMFTNLSRRSQGLIQRQLSLISELESREADPDQLSSLFKLDHLATRMRRNGENLLVLAGEEPGRRWTRPVPLVDVLRAAASEVEQYERIELSAVPGTEVAGRVVNDLVHLLAELLENATSFSSPQTKVKVTGHALPDGRVLVEIHDTGIGLSPEDLAAINERLASPPTVDVSVSRRMGLFVVGRLSLRHGIRIQLRPSDSGGTTALVMLPVDVAQGGKKPGAPTGKPGAPGAPQGGGSGGGAGLIGSAPSRRQVPQSGSRPALPGSGLAGLPTRKAGASSGGPAPTGGSLFDAGRPPGAEPRRSPGTPPGLPGTPPGLPGGRGGLPVRGDNPAVAPPTGAPSRGEGPGRPARPAESGARPQLPAREAAPELPSSQAPGTSWGARRAAQGGDDDWPSGPPSSEGRGGRDPLDAPRGHDDVDTGSQTSQFARPDLGQGPGDTGQFPQPDLGQGHGTTGQYARPDLGQGPGDTGQFPQPDLGQGHGTTGQYARPDLGQGPGDTGQFPQPDLGQGPGDTGQYARPDLGQGPGDTGQFPRPGAASGGYLPQGGPGVGLGGDTGEYPRPQADAHGSANGVAHSSPLDDPAPVAPAASGDFRTPIFDTIESNWFRGVPGAAEQDRQAAPAQPSREGQPAQDQGGEQRQPARAADTGASGGWNSSNDEHWRRAEQVREPASGGITSSGLPRRVPRANLVEGTAQQQTHQTGPQVSRAPDDVRGRLTNLRRGIQQGRQAGTGPGQGSGTAPGSNHDRGVGPTYQQER